MTEAKVQEHTRVFDDLRMRFDSVDRRFDAIDRRFEAVDRRFERVERRLDLLDGKLTSQFVSLVGIQITTLIAVVAALAGRR